MSLKGKTAIVGYGLTKPERHNVDATVLGLISDAAAKAIDDAGLRKEDIDGLVTYAGGVSFDGWAATVAEYIQIRPSFTDTPCIMGGCGAHSVVQAALALDAGLCNYVLVVAANAEEPQRSSARGGGPRPAVPHTPESEFEAPFGAAGAPSHYALAAQRHAFEYGTTDVQRAMVAVYQRTNASVNPLAIFYGQPITVEDVLKSRMISSPLHLLECVMPATGSGAYIMTTAERAKSLPNPPVYLLGAGETISHKMWSQTPRFSVSAGAHSGKKAYEMAGLRPVDMNMASVYDCFTITVMIDLEDAGFIKKGESGPWVESTDLTYKGKFPVNTHGGQLSFAQPGMVGGMTHVIDATEQLMGRAEKRQVPNCNLAFVEGNGGALSEHVSLIFGREQS